MKKLIEIKHDCLVQCDNPNCDYKYPYNEGDEKYLIAFVNIPCPKCGQNLLTPEDYILSEKTMKMVKSLNRLFSWITIFYSKKKKLNSTTVHIHNGITMTTTKDGIVKL